MHNNYLDDIKTDDLFIESDKQEEEIKEFEIPVEWSVFAKVPVKARNLQEAVRWVQDNKDIIPLNPEAEYIDGTYRLYDEDSVVNEEEYLAYIEEVWNTVGYPECYTTEDVYKEYCQDWCEERGYDYNSFDEETGQNGECYSCYDEFMDNEFINYVNGGILK